MVRVELGPRDDVLRRCYVEGCPAYYLESAVRAVYDQDMPNRWAWKLTPDGPVRACPLHVREPARSEEKS